MFQFLTVFSFCVNVKKMFSRIIIFFFALFLLSSLSAQDIPLMKKEAQLYRDKGYQLQQAGNLKEALVYYQKAVQLDPSLYQVYNDMGVILESLGRKEEAIKMYKKALEINPSYLPPYSNLALLYEEMGDTSNAIFYWKERYLLGKDARDKWWIKAAQHLAKLGAYSEARKEYLKIKMRPFYREISQRISQENLKKIEEANLHLRMGCEYLNQKRIKEAIDEFEIAFRINPPDEILKKEIKYYLEKAREEKTKQEARRYIEEALIHLDESEYGLTAEKLKDALSVIFSTQSNP